ncbi:MAG: hypothetical protein ACI4J2_06195 [Ruminococcus sp.]
MKKIVSLILCVSVLLIACSCGNNASIYKDNWRIISYYDMFEREKNGMFTTTNDRRLDFLDFETGEAIPLCDDPTCKHTSNSNCSAYGKSNHPFMVGQKLCWFEVTELYQTSNGYQSDLLMWQSDLNGENKKQLFKDEGASCTEADRFILYDNKLFYFETNQPYDSEFHEQEPSVSLKSYNFSDGTKHDYGKVVNGYSCGVWCCGVWEDKLYFSTSSAEDNRPYMERLKEYTEKNNLKDDEAFISFAKDDKYITPNWTMDIKNGTIESASKFPDLITNKYIYYLNDGVLSYKDHNNKTSTIKLNDVSAVQSLSSCCIINVKKDTYLWDEESKTVYLCPLDDETTIFYAYGDKVILRTNGENMSNPYSIVSLKEWAVKQ